MAKKLTKAKKRGQRNYRKATDAERKRHAQVRQQIVQEAPEIKNRTRGKRALLKKGGTPLRQVLTALRTERERQGLSLADIYERTGIDRAALSRLENNENANPTLNTLERYASAFGKQLVVLFSGSVK